jgi:ElaB/YqjD/DUF883 family membrane-anchored ribosome-binding protein
MSEMSKAKHGATAELSMADRLIEGAREKISDLTEAAQAQGSKLVKKATVKAEDLLEDVESEGKSAWKDAQTYVKKHPGAAVGGAIVLGALLYSLFNREEN